MPADTGRSDADSVAVLQCGVRDRLFVAKPRACLGKASETAVTQVQLILGSFNRPFLGIQRRCGTR